MKYFRCEWLHSDPDYPVVLYSEIDDERWETRKVDIYADGRRGFASQTEQSGHTQLGIESVPSFEEINSDPEFKLVEIERTEFEQVWAQRHSTNAHVPPPQLRWCWIKWQD
jgi:hypothetical protein